jgi:hypothetical protein
MTGRFVAVSNTIGNLAVGDTVLYLPLNVAYGTSSTNCVWFQFDVQLDPNNVASWYIWDINGPGTNVNMWPDGDYHYTPIGIVYTPGHEYNFSLLTSGTNTVTFTISDNTAPASWSCSTWVWTVPSLSMRYDTLVFSPASAVEGYTTNSQLTNVPYFQTKVGDGITTFWHSGPSGAPSGISSDVNVDSSGHYYWYMYDGIIDVAITHVTPSQTVVFQGYSANISVTAINQGDIPETFNVTVFANTTVISTPINIILAGGKSTIVTFTWNTTGFNVGNYTISAVADVVENETDTADNSYIDGIVTVRSPIHDIAVTDVAPSKTVVVQGYSMSIDVTVENQGDFTETFNVKTYVNTTQIEEKTVINLNPGSNRLLSFTWNTSGFDLGNYTISAVADAVSGETDISDNTCMDGIITVRLPIHDIAITDVTPSKTVFGQGYSLGINVTATNQGEWAEAFNVTAYANTTVIETKEITLTSGDSAILVLARNTTGWAIGNYALSANATILPNESDTGDNSYTDGTVTVRLPIYNVAVTGVVPSKTIVGQGYSVSVNVAVENQGDFTESFQVFAYADLEPPYGDEITIGAHLVANLRSLETTILSYTWNTSDFSEGNYTISAYAEPVPGETHIDDNTFTDGWIFVSMVGDINADGKVDVKDVYAVAKAYGTSLEGPNTPGRAYNPNCDINGDDKVDVKDYYIVCRHYGETTP